MDKMALARVIDILGGLIAVAGAWWFWPEIAAHFRPFPWWGWLVMAFAAFISVRRIYRYYWGHQP